MECLVSGSRRERGPRTPRSRRTLQPGRCSCGCDHAEHVRQQCGYREDREHGADRERDCAHLYQSAGDVSADDLLSAEVVREESAGAALETYVDSPAYESKRYGKTPWLDV